MLQKEKKEEFGPPRPQLPGIMSPQGHYCRHCQAEVPLGSSCYCPGAEQAFEVLASGEPLFMIPKGFVD